MQFLNRLSIKQLCCSTFAVFLCSRVRLDSCVYLQIRPPKDRCMLWLENVSMNFLLYCFAEIVRSSFIIYSWTMGGISDKNMNMAISPWIKLPSAILFKGLFCGHCMLLNRNLAKTVSSMHHTQLSNLWWMPNSVSKGFDTAMKTGSSRRFKRYPTTYSECQVSFPLLRIRKNQDKPAKIHSK